MPPRLPGKSVAKITPAFKHAAEVEASTPITIGAPPPIRGQWVEREVIVLDDQDKTFTITGKVYGGVAVVKQKLDKDLYSLVACRSKRLVAKLTTEEDCMRVGEYLWGNFCLAMREETSEAAKAKIPRWVLHWIRACRQWYKWVDPKTCKEEWDANEVRTTRS